MSIVPHIHRTLDLGRSVEHTDSCGLQGIFTKRETTRVKGGDRLQKRKISWLRSTASAHLAAGKRLCAVSSAANVPQGDL